MEFSISIRPGCQQFLRNMSKLYEIIIFTASHQKYADPIIDYLDPKRDMISYRLFRDNCYETENGVIKS